MGNLISTFELFNNIFEFTKNVKEFQGIDVAIFIIVLVSLIQNLTFKFNVKINISFGNKNETKNDKDEE